MVWSLRLTCVVIVLASSIEVWGQTQGNIAKPQAATAAGVWVKHPNNPMLSLGKDADFDRHNIFAPSVVKDGGKYWMFYAGGPSGPKSGEDFVRYQLGLALSDDGVRWSKQPKPLLELGERDDFHCVPTLLRTPEGELFKRDGIWHLLYNSNRPDDVDHATSRDGLTWVKDPGNPIFQRAYAPNVLQVGNEVRLYYISKPPRKDGKAVPWQVHLATGKDFDSLKDHPGNPILVLSQPWEKGALFYPYVLQEGKTWVMFYASYWQDPSFREQRTAIGMATSPDGIQWTKFGENPVLTPTSDSPFDSRYTSSQCVLKDGDGYKLYYGSRIDMIHKYFAIGLATKRGPLLPSP